MSDLIIGNFIDQLDSLQLHLWSYSYPRVINFSLCSAECIHSLVVLVFLPETVANTSITLGIYINCKYPHYWLTSACVSETMSIQHCLIDSSISDQFFRKHCLDQLSIRHLHWSPSFLGPVNIWPNAFIDCLLILVVAGNWLTRSFRVQFHSWWLHLVWAWNW